jgi:hypothetical protein
MQLSTVAYRAIADSGAEVDRETDVNELPEVVMSMQLIIIHPKPVKQVLIFQDRNNYLMILYVICSQLFTKRMVILVKLMRSKFRLC